MTNRARRGTVLLTGNSGYIGTVMAGRLKADGWSVVGYDTEWFKGNLLFPVPEAWQPDRQIVKDIRDVVAGDLDGIDGVIHLAGLSNDPLGEINPNLTDDINFKGSVKLAELCKARRISRFVFASSCSIYGIAPTDAPIDEHGVVNPLTAYAKAKADVEVALGALADDDFHPVFLRNATVYGLSPRLRLDLVANNLLAWAFLTGEINIMSDGTPWRPIVHIQDFSSAFLAALEAPADAVHAEVFNVGINSENYRVSEIAAEVNKVIPSAVVRILNKTGGDERTYRVDFTKIARTLPNFKPAWNLRKGLGELYEAYQKHLTQAGFDSDNYFRLRTVKSLLASGAVDNDLIARR